MEKRPRCQNVITININTESTTAVVDLTHQIKSGSVMHDIQSLHVAHFPVEELSDVDQLYSNRDEHRVTQPIQLVLLGSIAQ